MNNSTPSGVVFLDKPKGWTSRQAVNAVRRVFSTLSCQVNTAGKRGIKAGHTGTLDPMATGMLPILLGEATRFADYGLQADKRYLVSVDLSMQTDTFDAEGKLCERFDYRPSDAEIDQWLKTMHGPQQQIPPRYSAIRIQGKRAHELARQGQQVELEARPVTLYSLKKISYDYPLLKLAVHCSKGTYIRSLARDLGLALGCGACVTMLRRTSTAGWPADIMCTMAEVEASPLSCLHPTIRWLANWPRIELDTVMARRFAQGQRLAMPAGGQPTGEVAVCGDDGRLLGVGQLRLHDGRQVLHPKTVLPSAQA